MTKKVLFTISLILIAFIIKAQKNEYRYLAIKAGITHNYNFFSNKVNNHVMFRTANGDVPISEAGGINYIAGGSINVLYHLDSKTDKYGFVVGIEAQNNGFRNKFISENEKYWMVDQYRVQSIGIPFLVKFGNRNIYINQQYLFAGFQFNYFLVSQNIQRSSWNSERYSHALSANEKSNTGVVAFFGLNYFIFNFQLEFWASNFVNKDYVVVVGGNSLTPYSHLANYNVFLKTSINIPMNRWITTKNWTAEKVRRLFN